ncbi:MAG: hypothetical protein SGARI_002362, partial [Bacillariaceae sp.]
GSSKSSSKGASASLPSPADAEEVTEEQQSETEDKMDAAAGADPPAGPSIVYISESNELQQGVSTQTMVGAAFAVLLGVVLCVNLAFLWIFCKKGGHGEDDALDQDPYGTTIVVSNVKGGQVLVKKVVPMEDGSQIVSKTVYPDRETAVAHGFVVPEIA